MMATIAEKSRTKEIIDRLQAIINNASPVPLAPGKVTIYKDEVRSLLTELDSQMKFEIKTYHEVNDRKGKIINEAKKEAERIIYQAEHTASRMRVTRHTTNVAPLDYSMLDEEEKAALGNANEIYGASLIYTDEMLIEVNNLISDAYENIRSDYEIILQVLEEKMNAIAANREELMQGLQEMDTEDRDQQILEIGQLLSNELYNARMKARMDSDEYEDGSIQLSFDLEEQEEKAKQAEKQAQLTAQALAEMTAERDALMATVEKMKYEGMREAIRRTAVTQRTTGMRGSEFATVEKYQRNLSGIPTDPAKQESTGDEEYEIVYVTEDQLEEGEEYEIEYVEEDEPEGDEEYEIEYVEEDEPEEDEEYEIEYVEEDEPEEDEEYEIEYVEEDEPEKGKKYEAEDTGTGGSGAEGSFSEKKEKNERKEIPEETEETPKEDISEPVKKEENVESKSGEAKEAIKELESLEKELAEIPVIPHFKKQETKAPASNEKDEDIKTDENGNKYVQASMKFDENFEIMEFE